MSRRQDRVRFSGLSAGRGADPAVQDLLNGAVENRAALTRKQRRDRQRKRMAYDLDPAVIDAVRRAARTEDTSASQLVNFLLAYALHAYAQGEGELATPLYEGKEGSRSPRFAWNLSVPAAWLESIQALLRNGPKPPSKSRGWGVK